MNVQERWDAKLTNWALWIVGGRSCGVGAPDREWWNHPPRPPQPLVGEAKDTDALVQRLGMEQQQAVRAWYTWTGPVHARALDLGVPYVTWRERVIQARFRLEELAILRRSVTVAPAPQVAFMTA